MLIINKKMWQFSSLPVSLLFETLQYMGTTLTNQNSIQEETKWRLKSGNVCYHSVQNYLSSSLLSKNIKIKIHRNIILPVILYGCETWSLILREECRLMVFKKRVLRELFGYQVDRVPGEWRRPHKEEFYDLYCSPNVTSVVNAVMNP